MKSKFDFIVYCWLQPHPKYFLYEHMPYQLALWRIRAVCEGRIHLDGCMFALFFDRSLWYFDFAEEAVFTLFAKRILELAICSFIHMTVWWKRDAKYQKQVGSYTYKHISLRSHSNTDSIKSVVNTKSSRRVMLFIPKIDNDRQRPLKACCSFS